MRDKETIFKQLRLVDVFPYHSTSPNGGAEEKLFSVVQAQGYGASFASLPDGMSLDDMEYLLEQGRVTEAQAVAYVMCWACWGRLTRLRLKQFTKPFRDTGMRCFQFIQQAD